MQRRRLILALAAMWVVPSMANASPEASAPEAVWVTMTGVGLPVFIDGRVRNHIFVEMKLHLKAGFAVEKARAKDTVMRDALVREGHRRSFGMADNWNRIDERALATAVMQIAATHLGRGNVVRVEIVRQTPRRRVRTVPVAPAR